MDGNSELQRVSNRSRIQITERRIFPMYRNWNQRYSSDGNQITEMDARSGPRGQVDNEKQ